jgi:branched-subunit amino acid transport protein AzlD
MPPAVHKLASKMPAAIIAVLVIYCLKSVPTSDITTVIINLVSVAAVVGLHLWKRNTLLSIAGGTVLYMVLLRII